MLKMREHARKTDAIVQETKAGKRVVEQKEEVIALLTTAVPGSTPVYYSWSFSQADGGCWCIAICAKHGGQLKSKRFRPDGEVTGFGRRLRRKGPSSAWRTVSTGTGRGNHQPRDINTVLDIVHEDLSPEDRVTLAKALRAYT